MNVREARPDELSEWDARAVNAPGGHVYQSRAWADYQATAGWRPRYLRFDDGFGVLALQRSWPGLPGGSAYLTRGPIAGGEPPEQTADRLIAATAWLGRNGIDVVAADPEIAASTGFGDRLRHAGFHPIDELQPSRHRMRLPLEGHDEEATFARFARSTRQRIRQAERSGATVLQPPAPIRPHLDRFYDLLVATGERRGFTFGPRREFVTWWERAHGAGHLIFLAAHAQNDDRLLAGLVLFRHGERLSTVHSADVARVRETHPGLPHLLRWRAIQLALAEGWAEMDLGGADVAGARRIPLPGEPVFGLYEHKRSFGAEWLELTGAYERIVRPQRYRAGRIAARLRRVLAPARLAR